MRGQTDLARIVRNGNFGCQQTVDDSRIDVVARKVKLTQVPLGGPTFVVAVQIVFSGAG